MKIIQVAYEVMPGIEILIKFRILKYIITLIILNYKFLANKLIISKILYSLARSFC